MSIIAEVRENNELWEKSVYGYIEKALLHYASTHDIFAQQSIKELSLMINVNYSTHMSNVDLNVIAEELPKIKDIKKRLAEGDLSLVEEINDMTVNKGSGNRCLSFASKFCYMYNREKFPIYDSLARKILISWYKHEKQWEERVKPNELDYQTYVKIYQAYQTNNDLQEFTLWQMDKYFWIKGKKNNGTAFTQNSLIK